MPKSNIFIFYGEDDFSLHQKLEFWKKEFTQKYSAQAIITIDSENLDEQELADSFEQALSPTLFASKKLIIAKNCLPKGSQIKLQEKILEVVNQLPKDYFLVFWQSTSFDRRLTFTKQLLAFKPKLVEFSLPHSSKLNEWIEVYAQQLGMQISKEAVETLAQFLGRDLYEEIKAGGKTLGFKEAFDLWQVSLELNKLASFKSKIEPEDVKQLVNPKIPTNVFAFSDEVLNHNEKKAFEALENLLVETSGDEKSAIIKLVALLAEQIRALMLVNLLTLQGLDQPMIAQRLGWSQGRVFAVQRHAKNADFEQLKVLLKKLLLIDLKLKTSDINPLLELDLFVSEATKH